MTNETWFHELLADALQRHEGKQAALASEIGISRRLLNSWLSGVNPQDMTLVKEVIKRLGGDLERALPGYQPTTREKLHVIGSVEAGDATIAMEDGEEYEGMTGLWERSRLWPLSFGAVVYFRIHGDSMFPQYPQGCLIAARRTNLPPERFPNLTPVIFYDHAREESTFKLLQIVLGRKTRKPSAVLGNAINPRHECLVWALADVRVSHVVLGKLELHEESAIARPRHDGYILHESTTNDTDSPLLE